MVVQETLTSSMVARTTLSIVINMYANSPLHQRKMIKHTGLYVCPLTGVSSTQHLYWRRKLLLANSLVLLLLGGSLQPLPGQATQVEVHQHVPQRLKVVTTTLL